MINRIIHAKIHIAWHISPRAPISALGAFGPRADMGPLGLICHAIWILPCIILFIIYYQAKIAVVKKDNDCRFVCCDVLFHCDVIDMHLLHAC